MENDKDFTREEFEDMKRSNELQKEIALKDFDNKKKVVKDATIISGTNIALLCDDIMQLIQLSRKYKNYPIANKIISKIKERFESELGRDTSNFDTWYMFDDKSIQPTIWKNTSDKNKLFPLFKIEFQRYLGEKDLEDREYKEINNCLELVQNQEEAKRHPSKIEAKNIDVERLSNVFKNKVKDSRELKGMMEVAQTILIEANKLHSNKVFGMIAHILHDCKYFDREQYRPFTKWIPEYCAIINVDENSFKEDKNHYRPNTKKYPILSDLLKVFPQIEGKNQKK